jgi:hypothetical protein
MAVGNAMLELTVAGEMAPFFRHTTFEMASSMCHWTVLILHHALI